MSEHTIGRQLSDLQIDEISTVDRGANQFSKIVFSKRADKCDCDKSEVCEKCVVGKSSPGGLDLHAPKPVNQKGTHGPGAGKKTEGKAAAPKDDDTEVTESGQEGLAQDVADDTVEGTTPGSAKDEGDGDWKPKKGVKKDWREIIAKLFDTQSTTSSGADDSLDDMSDSVEKFGFGGAPKPQLPGQQFPPSPAQPQAPFGHPGMMAPAPTGAPQGAMAPGQLPPAGPLAQPQPQMAQLPPEVVSYIQELEQALSQAQGGQEPQEDDESDTGGKKMSDFGKSAHDADEQFLEELAKSLEDADATEAVSKALEEVAKAHARAEEAEKIAKAERDLRVEREFVAKAEAYNVPVSPAELGPVLKRLHESLSEEDVAVIEKCLTAHSDATAALFGEVGKRGTGYNGDVANEVEARVAEVAKSDSLTPAQAYAKVLEENPALYDQMLKG